MSQKAILVLGMHRSGTSALTSGLSTLGVSVEKDDSTAEENPKGYYEDWDAVSLNDSILEDKGLSWSNPFVGELKWDESDFDEYVPQISSVLEKKYSDRDIWAIKDPRLCLVLPLWTKAIQQTLNCEIYHIHAIRNPLEVAHSLESRRKKSKKFYCGDIQQSVLLWFFYHYTSLINSRRQNNIFISFEDIINNSAETLSTIANFINVKYNSDKLKEYSSSFIEKNLQHHHFTKNDLKEKCFGLDFIANFYDNLIRETGEALDQHKINDTLKTIPDITQVFSCSKVASPIFQEIYHNNSHLFYITQQVQAELENKEIKESELMSLPDIYGLWQGQVRELNIALNKREDEYFHLSRKYEEQVHVVSNLKKELGDRNHIINQATNRKIFFNKTIYSKFLALRLTIVKIMNYLEIKKLNRQIYSISSSGLFDHKFYLSQCTGNTIDEGNNIKHYLTIGYYQGLQPNAEFNHIEYYINNPKVLRKNINPFVHYLRTNKVQKKI